MALNSAPYVLFLAAAAVLHRLVREAWRSGLLLAISWLFYLLCAPRAFPLLLLTTAWTFVLGRVLARRTKKRRLWLALGLTVNLGALFLFKYLGFFASLLSALLGWLGLAPLTVPALLLPVGISFYTFLVCGYLMDVYRGRRPAEERFWQFALFVSFFPAILSGPIERSTSLLPQLQARPRANGDDVKTGVTRFLTGLAKKMILADQLAVVVNTAYAAPENFTGVQLLAAALAYSLQIYCDFSAYSDMAVGSARLFGVRLTENFDAPYLARSVQEFWRKWHISLSSWFRDYLYFPLGGSRRGTWRRYLNVLIVFAVSGLWHGAAGTFLVWGLLNGLYQVLGGLLTPARTRVRARLGVREDAKPLRWAQTLLTFLLITVTWVFFRAGSMDEALSILRRIVTLAGGVFPLGLGALGLGRKRLLALLLAVLVLFAGDVWAKRRRWAARLCASVWPRYAVWSALVLLIAVLGAYGAGYDPQEFAYFKF